MGFVAFSLVLGFQACMPDLDSVSSRPLTDDDDDSTSLGGVGGKPAVTAGDGNVGGDRGGETSGDPSAGAGGGESEVLPACSDGVQGEDESDIDCGGPSECYRCDVGSHCTEGSDCVEGVCRKGVCAEPTCSDGVRNHDETGKDCGGWCAPDQACALDEGCATDEDCESGYCAEDGICTHHCKSERLDGDETAIDCGGSCAPCEDGLACAEHADCVNEKCVDGVCIGPTCTDEELNQDESDVDCGGVCGATCLLGASCDSPSDCETYVCESGQCANDIEIPAVAMIDDLEDGNLTIPATEERVGSWYVYGDGSGTVSYENARLTPKRGPSSYAIHTKGSNNTVWGAGVGFDIKNPGGSQATKLPYDASAYSGITFWARAAKTVTVQVVFPDRNTDMAGGVCTSCDHHWLKAITVDTEWRRYVVRFSELALESGGSPIPTEPDPTGLISIQFRTFPGADYDYWVDDIAFWE